MEKSSFIIIINIMACFYTIYVYQSHSCMLRVTNGSFNKETCGVLHPLAPISMPLASYGYYILYNLQDPDMASTIVNNKLDLETKQHISLSCRTLWTLPGKAIGLIRNKRRHVETFPFHRSVISGYSLSALAILKADSSFRKEVSLHKKRTECGGNKQPSK